MDRLNKAINRVKTWMSNNGADAIVANLGPGTTDEQLQDFESQIGFKCPDELKALWSIHAGQNDDGNPFAGALNLLTPEQAVHEREHILLSLEFLREDPDSYEEAGINDAEAESDEWISIAAQGYADQLIVNVASGRVFTCEKDAPPLHLVAASIAEWLESYAADLEKGHYEIEEGFGGIYLSSVDSMY